MNLIAHALNNTYQIVINNKAHLSLDNYISNKNKLVVIIDDKVDSLRFYYLGNNYKTKIEHIGVERGIAVDQPLFL